MNTHAKSSVFKDPTVARHLSELHDKYVVIPSDKAHSNMVFVCKLHYIDCLIKNKALTVHLVTQHIPQRHLPKNKSLAIIGQFCFPLEFQLKMKNIIFLNLTGLQSFTSVLTSNVTLQDLPIAPQNLFLRHFQFFYQ